MAWPSPTHMPKCAVKGLAGRPSFHFKRQQMEDVTYWVYVPRSLSEKQCSKRYASLVECKDATYSTTKSRLL